MFKSPRFRRAKSSDKEKAEEREHEKATRSERKVALKEAKKRAKVPAARTDKAAINHALYRDSTGDRLVPPPDAHGDALSPLQSEDRFHTVPLQSGDELGRAATAWKAVRASLDADFGDSIRTRLSRKSREFEDVSLSCEVCVVAALCCVYYPMPVYSGHLRYLPTSTINTRLNCTPPPGPASP